MAVPARGTEADAAPDGRDDDTSLETTVSMHSTRPERTVFVEEDNVDGWIATDLTVSLDR
ncbi:hypothetical protein [Halococcus saccharolyticus]|uniref:Uncharacterized protein n=1 Tax=Halococcus saccharolyticus DSM 5350 TaxID=1227455 RepID=M0MJ53_9EURY|nr:hypothetical protein [Halococcus saccharolyticus]EMA45383.1 hypothetical protein C449_07150 [Halococcus saccharolyticus DSM 5350]